MWQFIVAAALLAAPADIEVQTLDGQSIGGRLVGWTDGAIVVDTADGEQQTLPIGRLLRLEPVSPPPVPETRVGVVIELIDGSRLPASSYTVEETTVRLALAGGQEVELPLAQVAAARLKAPDEAVNSQWQAIRQKEVVGDLIVIRKQDALDYLSGVLGQVTPDRVYFKLEGDEIPVNRDKVEGLVYYRPQVKDLPEAICVICAPGGEELFAQAVEFAGLQLKVTSLAGPVIEMPLGRVAEIDFSAGKVRYLSDLEPDAFAWTPYIDFSERRDRLASHGRPGMNRSLEGGPLVLLQTGENGRREEISFRKGLALRSHSEVTYRLPGKFRRFQALAGIDARVRQRGNVRLVIQGDDKTLLDVPLDGHAEPLAIDLDISGVRRMTILVDYGEELDIGDHLDLCDARIIK